MRSTSENSYVFNSRDEMYLEFNKKRKFSFILYFFCLLTEKGGAENAKKTRNF